MVKQRKYKHKRYSIAKKKRELAYKMLLNNHTGKEINASCKELFNSTITQQTLTTLRNLIKSNKSNKSNNSNDNDDVFVLQNGDISNNIKNLLHRVLVLMSNEGIQKLSIDNHGNVSAIKTQEVYTSISNNR